MLKLLVKKQLMEVFKGYFYDAKKNKARPKGQVIAWFVFFGVLMFGLLSGMVTMLCLGICEPLSTVGMGWLYYLILSCIAILLGAFGSVFNTFHGLYLSKDNDLLLSMPIPSRLLVTSRLVNVYLMGLLYSSVVFLPAMIVDWIVMGFTVSRFVCGLLWGLMLTCIVLILSCLLGWVVAKVSVKIKSKSIITVLSALLGVGLYYFLYFKAVDLVNELIGNALLYGEQIKGAAYGLYLFGEIGQGNWLATLLFIAITAVLLTLTWLLLSKTFLSMATASGKQERKKYKEQAVKSNSVFTALLKKELKKFTSSPNYMLNCGLGILFTVAVGVALLFKGDDVQDLLSAIPDLETMLPVFLIGILGMTASMVDTAAPSVSLEGKNIWITQSLPVDPKWVLRAKTAMQILLSGIPMLFTAVCALIVFPMDAIGTVAILLLSLTMAVFMALVNNFFGTKLANLTWTNEIVPIKQGIPVIIAIFGAWILSVLFIGSYFLCRKVLSLPLFYVLWEGLLVIGIVLFSRWLDTKGAKKYATL